MNEFPKYFILPFLIGIGFLCHAQTSLNVDLFGQFDRGDQRYSGSWSYQSPSGEEYALLGAYSGLAAYSVDDASQIKELGFIPGPGSNWREITVVKDHAYVTTEGSQTGTGMQVVDLRYLPDSLHLVTTYTATFTRGHIIQSDIYNPNSEYVYVSGSSQAMGVQILDVFDPSNPVEVGLYNPYYIHDVHVRGDRLYAAALYESAIDVLDISDKTNPTLITQIDYSGGFTHSSWTTEDNKFLLVTDEVDGLKMNIWNIEDINNPYRVADWSANLESLVHNPYVRGDFAFISHNTEGLRVLDVVKPDLPVEVGFYDTYSGASGGFSGLWSACPFFTSDKIIGGNREDGLYIWEFNNTHAGRIYGQVTDADTGLPIFNAILTISNFDTLNSNLDGNFKWGSVAGTYSIGCSKTGYYSKTISGINLAGSDSLWLEIELEPKTVANEVATIAKNISVGPNPFSDYLFIDGLKESKQSIFFELYSMDGKLVIRENGFSPRIDITKLSLADELYIYSIKEANGKTIRAGKLFYEK